MCLWSVLQKILAAWKLHDCAVFIDSNRHLKIETETVNTAQVQSNLHELSAEAAESEKSNRFSQNGWPQHRMTLTFYRCGKPSGTWNSTPRSARLYICQAPKDL